MKISKLLLSMFLLSVLIISCDNDDNEVFEPKGDYENGLLISGEGGSVSGSISFVSNDFNTVEHQIYSQVNEGKEFGTYLQSISFDGDNAYITVDASNSITAVNRYTFEENGVISEGLILPRFMTVVDGVGYATNWGSTSDATDDFIAVIDLNTYTVTSTIPVGNGPERIIERNGKLYVSHKGAWSTNNIVSVIDISSKNVEEIIVADRPDELFFDNSGYLWVLSEGQLAWSGSESKGSIAKINVSNNSVVNSFDFDVTVHPETFVIDENVLYYSIGAEIFSMNANDLVLPTEPIMDSGAGYLYGIAAKGGYLFVLDASFSSQSKLDIYTLNTLTKVTTVNAPLGASKIYFN